MSLYTIAELQIDMEPKGELLKRQAVQYLSGSNPAIKQQSADMMLHFTDSMLQCIRKEIPQISYDDAEYRYLGFLFALYLLKFNGIQIHASAVAYQEQAYLFSADSGVGKSTHTALWKTCFGEKNAFIINDDKPVIRLIDGILQVCGSPFSGKTDLSRNVKVPLKAICMLERGPEQKIIPLPTEQSVPLLLRQTLRVTQPENICRQTEMLDRIVRSVPIYKMSCDMTLKAAKMAYHAMSG